MYANVGRCDDGEKAFDHLKLHCLVSVLTLEAVGHSRDDVVVECSVWDAIGVVAEKFDNIIHLWNLIVHDF